MWDERKTLVPTEKSVFSQKRERVHTFSFFIFKGPDI
jgi:hypothetical protein